MHQNHIFLGSTRTPLAAYTEPHAPSWHVLQESHPLLSVLQASDFSHSGLILQSRLARPRITHRNDAFATVANVTLAHPL